MNDKKTQNIQLQSLKRFSLNNMVDNVLIKRVGDKKYIMTIKLKETFYKINDDFGLTKTHEKQKALLAIFRGLFNRYKHEAPISYLFDEEFKTNKTTTKLRFINLLKTGRVANIKFVKNKEDFLILYSVKEEYRNVTSNNGNVKGLRTYKTVDACWNAVVRIGLNEALIINNQ